MGRSDFSPGVDWLSLPSSSLPLGGPGEISWGKVKQCPAASALNTPRPRSDIGRRVDKHACPGPRSLHKGSLSFSAAVRIRLPSHTPSRERLRLSIVQTPSRAVAFTSRLPPTGPAGDFHPQSLHHAQRTCFGYASAAFSATARQRTLNPRFSHKGWYIVWGKARSAHGHARVQEYRTNKSCLDAITRRV